MEVTRKNYDCAIIGGGLAGLCLAVQLARLGVSVIVFEKNAYPFHKVCGEYISMESRDFLCDIGLPWDELALPVIRNLGISSVKGFMLEHPLGLGGFGISRYTLDDRIAKLAIQNGADLIEHCKVTDVMRDENNYLIKTSSGDFKARVVCGSYGKYTPQFVSSKKKELVEGQYIGVKYHIKTNLPADRIELHNFEAGYCGISKVDHDWFCLCYLSSAKNLLRNARDIRRMEENVLCKNPYLKKIFLESEFVSGQPLVISNVHFRKKQTVAGEMLLLGDAAGSITPLCGNGMSMGMRSSKLLAEQLFLFFENKQSAASVRKNYTVAWNRAFEKRITAGYYLQGLFGKNSTTDLALRILKTQPWLMKKLISLTHGDVF